MVGNGSTGDTAAAPLPRAGPAPAPCSRAIGRSTATAKSALIARTRSATTARRLLSGAYRLRLFERFFDCCRHSIFRHADNPAIAIEAVVVSLW
jgi:hypothetical protein